MKKIRVISLTAILAIIISSCTSYNRLTSPEILDKEERIWSFGASIDPLTTSNGSDADLLEFQPLISYRTGLGANSELGITMQGIHMFGPGITIDYKHRFQQFEKNILSGNIAVWGGIFRPIGMQYDVLYGTHKRYATVGVSYDFLEFYFDTPALTIGIGSERINSSPFGIQVSYTNQNLYLDEGFLTIGLKFDFLKKKRRYR